MTYNAFFDALFYNYWVGFGVLGVYVAIVLVIRNKYYKESEQMWPGVILYFLIPFMWIMTMGQVNPFAWGYGKPTEIKDVMMMHGDLFVKDYILSSGSKGMRGVPSYRVHVIDPVTGHKKLRFVPGGSGTLMSERGDSLIFGYSNAVIFYSKTNGKDLLEWTAKTLPGIYPQLKMGVSDFQVDRDDKEISITSLDGNKWVLNIYDKSLTPYDPKRRDREREQERNELRLTTNGISTSSKRYAPRVVGLCERADGEHQMVLCGHRDSIISNEVFLYGKMVALSLKDSCFVISHYETIEKLKVIFTCMSLDGKKKLWEYRQDRSSWTIFGDKSPTVSCCIDHADGIFVASIKDELIAMRMTDGRILWRQIP